MKGSQNGISNNPNGRPKLGAAITPFLRSEGDVDEEVTVKGELKKLPRKQILAMRIWREALAGDYNFIKLIVNYVDGMPIQPIAMGNIDDENPILIGITKLIETEKVIEVDSQRVDGANPDGNNVQP